MPSGGIARLHQVIDAEVDGLADQGGAKANRDGVDRAKAQRHGRDGHQDARHHRQQPHQQRARRAVDRQQQRHHQHGADQRQALDFAFDDAARGHGKVGRAGHGERKGSVAFDARKFGVGAGQHLLLRIGVCAGGAQHGHEQGALPIGRAQHTGLGVGVGAGRGQAVEHMQHFCRGVARQQGLEQAAGGRGQQLQRLAQGLGEALRGERFGRDAVAQRVAVGHQEGAIAVAAGCIAIEGALEVGAAPHPRGQLGRGLRTLLGRAAFNAQKQHARQRTLADLVNQQLLLGRGVFGQEGRHVGAVARLRQHRHAAKHQRQPGQPAKHALAARQSQLGRLVHGLGVMSMTARSPSACSVVMRVMAFCLPSTTMRRTSLATRLSLGTSCMRHCGAVPVTVKR